MLLKLSIQNYLLIKDLELDFASGFTVITGETGAGKSIILGALNLILGQRNDSSVVFDKTRKCIIEGLFRISGYVLDDFFKKNDLDYDELLTVRKEISDNGKSRSFINDSPVTLSVLKELGERLVNIHSQNSIITLHNADFQIAVIDSFARIQEKVSAFRSTFQNWNSKKNTLEELIRKEAKLALSRDYDQFLYDELSSARLNSQELLDLEEKQRILINLEEIRGNLRRASQVLSGDEVNILSQLKEVSQALNQVSGFQADIKLLAERINYNYIDIKDLSNDISLIGNRLDGDPGELESISQRLDQLYRLLKKHQKSNIDDLIDLYHEIESKLSRTDNLGQEIRELKKEVTDLKTDLLTKAKEISILRKNIIPVFTSKVENSLVQLGIPFPTFRVELQSADDLLTSDGLDKVKFLFSANKGLEASDIETSISGGESSRLMLTIKSMISQKNLLPTIFFDEIDSGVSGKIAGMVGKILNEMGSTMQVIAITHLPQIAAKSSQHFLVYKINNQDITQTNIKKLSNKERIEEIAKMLSNEKVTPSAIKNAKDLLNN
ncbi:MAG: DNA repair protein RecN [Bacteroidales bacterium]|nr:DNA repair protein RecN [Bacteroidales bacterium]